MIESYQIDGCNGVIQDPGTPFRQLRDEIVKNLLCCEWERAKEMFSALEVIEPKLRRN